ncbi:MAG: Hint domain-containing protein [Acetobacteraceae bacterium]
MAGSYSWAATGSGQWGFAGNWFDITSGTTATTAPAAGDIALVESPAPGTITVAGPGSAQALTLNGAVGLSGSFALDAFVVANPAGPPQTGTTESNVTLAGVVTAGAVSIGSLYGVPGLSSQQVNLGTVELGEGALLAAGTVALKAGTLEADGGSLSVDGSLTLGQVLMSPRPPTDRMTSGVLDLTDNAHAQVGMLWIVSGTVSLDATSSLEIGHAGTTEAGTTETGTITVDADGTLSIGDFFHASATATIAAPVVNNGGIVDNGFTDLSDIINNGTITLRQASIRDIDGAGLIFANDGVTIGAGVHGTVWIGGNSGGITLDTGAPPDPATTPIIADLVDGTSLFLPGITADSAQFTESEDFTGILSLGQDGTTVASLRLLGNYPGNAFAVSLDDGGSTITTSAPCFLAGTRILTPRGEIQVERLRAGAAVTTQSGGSRKVRWLGHRSIRTAGHPHPEAVLPVRIAAGAFGERLPRRDLYLSPDHAVFAEGVLVPIKYLINGATIVQVARRTARYWHVELDAHDILLAEGLPAESYLETGGRAQFANGGVVAALHPNFASLAWEAGGCAPLAVAGPAVERLRRRITDALPPPPAGSRPAAADSRRGRPAAARSR